MAIDPNLSNLRRLTGANLLMAGTGAAAEAGITGPNKSLVMALWKAQARAVLDAMGWTSEQIKMRAFPGGATLQISAPTDTLMAAQDVVTLAWSATLAQMNGAPLDILSEAETIRLKSEAERNPAEVALQDAALAHGVTYLGHDDKVSLGLGVGAQVFDADNLPDIDSIDWSQIHDIPVAMVTGTNGKSTTVRLTAAIGAAASKAVGLSSSDWVRVDGEILDEGDYSGPAGARLAVRDPRVELAVIETARGGLMRRGLPVPRADACLLTNVAADHLGSYGITDVPSLADAKFQLADAVKPDGRLVLNADDPELVARSVQFDGEITWFGLDLDSAAIEVWIKAGQRIVFVEDGQMVLARDGEKIPVIAVNDFKPSINGAAKFNVYNALGAIGLADALGLPIDAMTNGLAGFTDSPDENPGRGNYIEVGGLTLLIDFAHNPHGVKALGQAVQAVPAKRRAAIATQAGDRSDKDTSDMIEALWDFGLDAMIIAELPTKLRGRQPGELTKVMHTACLSCGAREDQIIEAAFEYDAVVEALKWAQDGDFLALLVHDDRKKAMELIERLKESGWQAGEPLP